MGGRTSLGSLLDRARDAARTRLADPNANQLIDRCFPRRIARTTEWLFTPMISSPPITRTRLISPIQLLPLRWPLRVGSG